MESIFLSNMGIFQMEPQSGSYSTNQEEGDNRTEPQSRIAQGERAVYMRCRSEGNGNHWQISREAVNERSKGRAVGILQSILKREDLLSITFNKA